MLQLPARSDVDAMRFSQGTELPFAGLLSACTGSQVRAARAGRFTCGLAASPATFGSNRLHGGAMTFSCAPLARCRPPLARERPPRGCTSTFSLQSAMGCAGATAGCPAMRATLTLAIVTPCLFAGSRRRLTGCPQLHAGAPRFGEANGNGLLGRSRTMFSFANVVHLLADELSRLGAGGFPLALVFACMLNRFLLRHSDPLSEG